MAELAPHSPGGAPLTLDRGSVDIWLAFDAQFCDSEIAQFAARLSAAETERMQKLRLPTGQRQFAITRALQRHALSSYETDIPPSSWEFRKSAEGRPALAAPFDRTGLHFNLSHTEGLVAMAVCRHALLGLDVEKLKAAPLAVIDRFFSPVEVAQLRALPAEAQSRRFMQVWTLKEAYLKAVGAGLAGGLGRMSFIFDPTGGFHFERAEDSGAARWQFHQHFIGAHILGIAVFPDVSDTRLGLTWREFRAGS